MKKSVDNLVLYDPQVLSAARKIAEDIGGSSAMGALASATDLEEHMKTFVGVKQLFVLTHGGPGKVYVPIGGKMWAIYQHPDWVLYAKYTEFLAKDARVLFMGCNVGEGSQGDMFMSSFAQHMLKGKGGIVGATTTKNLLFMLGPWATDLWMLPLSFGRLKVRKYSIEGKEIGAMNVDRHGIRR